MKKFGILCVSLLICLSLAACGSQSHSKSAARKSSSSKVVKKHRHKKRVKKAKKQSSSSSTTSSASSANQQSQSSQQTQGQINRQRGYDPNGNPLLPGQDHAAGSNPDGSEDDWVRGQDEWIHQHPEINQQPANNQPSQPTQQTDNGNQQ